jgi:transglutaminase-like putative cysteine protease
MLVKVGCDLTYRCEGNVPLFMLVRPREQYTYHKLIKENRLVEPDIPLMEFQDIYGNNVWRLIAPTGELHLRYSALAEVPPTPDPVLPELDGQFVQNLPDNTLLYLLASRHCQSDLVISQAWEMFGSYPSGWQRVQAICDWLKTNVPYGSWSNSNTSGYEAFNERKGVCRDFAHMGVMLCRALSMPARYVCGYLPDINVTPDPAPMDFHAWFEVYLNGAWRTFDARHNIPRTGRVFIGYGRDAVDVSLVTSYGNAKLQKMKVWADEVKEEDLASVMEEFN